MTNRYTPRTEIKFSKDMEDRWRAESRLLEIMDLVVAEWNTDPMSVQCFDLRIVEEAKQLCAKRRLLLQSTRSSIF